MPAIFAHALGLMREKKCHVVFQRANKRKHLANTRKGGHVCSFSLNETTILILQKVQFAVRTSSTVATVSNHFIIVFKIIRSSFSVV